MKNDKSTFRVLIIYINPVILVDNLLPRGTGCKEISINNVWFRRRIKICNQILHPDVNMRY